MKLLSAKYVSAVGIPITHNQAGCANAASAPDLFAAIISSDFGIDKT